MSPSDVPQIHHIARMSFLAMAARGVAGAEFDTSPDITEVVIRVSRSPSGTSEMPLDLEFLGHAGMPLGGLSL